jgi:two-component system sensor histidine kinase ChvG
LGQVIRNLIDNAISFSPENGMIRVAARRGRDEVVIVVEDDGPGVPEDKREKIFDRFYSERPESQGFGNHSGLGLNICREIVTVHNGTIRAENRYGPRGVEGPCLGARFVMTLPAIDPRRLRDGEGDR